MGEDSGWGSIRSLYGAMVKGLSVSSRVIETTLTRGDRDPLLSRYCLTYLAFHKGLERPMRSHSMILWIFEGRSSSSTSVRTSSARFLWNSCHSFFFSSLLVPSLLSLPPIFPKAKFLIYGVERGVHCIDTTRSRQFNQMNALSVSR